MTKSDLIRRWYTQVWEQGDLDAIDRMFRADSRANGIVPGMSMNPEDFRDLVTAVLNLIDPPRIDVKLTLEQDDWVAAIVTIHAQAQKDGAKINVPGFVCARVEGDQMVETYNCFDFISFFGQMGLLPANTVELCLTGTAVG